MEVCSKNDGKNEVRSKCEKTTGKEDRRENVVHSFFPRRISLFHCTVYKNYKYNFICTFEKKVSIRGTSVPYLPLDTIDLFLLKHYQVA